jgi:hypothetical protein
MSTNDDEAVRSFARALFATDEPDHEPEPEPAPDTARGNHVPREGNNPDPGPVRDFPEYVAALFNRAHN